MIYIASIASILKVDISLPFFLQFPDVMAVSNNGLKVDKW